MSDRSEDSIIVLSDEEDYGNTKTQVTAPSGGASSPSPVSDFASRLANTYSHFDPVENPHQDMNGGDFNADFGNVDPEEPATKRQRVSDASGDESRVNNGLFVDQQDTNPSNHSDLGSSDAMDQGNVQKQDLQPPKTSMRLGSLNGPVKNGSSTRQSRPPPPPAVNTYVSPENQIVVISDDEEDDSGDFSRSFAEPTESFIEESSGEEVFHDAAPGPDINRRDDVSSDIEELGPASGSGPADGEVFHNYSEDDFVAETGGGAPPVEESSDDEIAILSKEEAERVGTFKRSTFEKPASAPALAPAPRNQPAPAARPVFNQPAPVYHAGEESPLTTGEDLAIRNYFMRFTVPQLEKYERDIDVQLGRVQAETKAYYDEVQETRAQLSMLTVDQVALRDQLLRNVTERLELSEASLQKSRKVRRYRSIVESVKASKLAPPEFPLGFSMGSNVVDIDAEPMYGANINPYTSRPANDEQTHLQDLFRDLCKEEKVEGMAPTPEALSIQLLDHQRRGLFWLLEKEKAKQGCILADDMGLGKTVQTLAVMTANLSVDPGCKTTLIVGPVSLLRQWDAEIKAKINPTHSLSVAFFHGQERRNLTSFRQMAQYDVILTSYTTLASEFKQHFAWEMEQAMTAKNSSALPQRGTGGQRYMSPFYSREANFYRIVLDEAQYIRNKLSQASKAAACLRGRHHLCLTGTPMQNNIEELYPILRFLGTKPYDEEPKFKKDISVPLKSNNDNFDDYDRNQSMKKLRAVLSAVMLRRTKDSMIDGKPLIQLPKKTIEQVFVKMENDELEYYKALESGIQKKAKKLMNSAKHTGNILTLLLRLRQACIHQLLVEVGELNSQENSDSFKGNNWVQMYNRTERMNERVKANVRAITGNHAEFMSSNDGESPSNEVQLTCPVCFDVVSEDSIVILANCGHMVCDGCTSTLFGEDGAQQEASCMACNAPTSMDDLVNYQMYSNVFILGHDLPALQRIYGMTNTKKTTNSEKVKFLLQRDQGFTPSAKMERTLDLIKDITETTSDEKIIIFSHFTVTFDLMGHALKQDNIEFLRYDGSMNIDDKNQTISEFYQGTPRVLLISLKAGNVGLTLTCASHVVIMDPFWNPYVEDQAMDRAHRFGQERPVKVYRLLIRDSVEDRIMDLQQRKKELIGAALDESALKSSSSLGRRELGYLFGLNSLR